MPKTISYQTILAAKAGDAEAMAAILRHYSRYITYYSRRTYTDKYGNRYDAVNEDIKQRIEAKLMYQIIEKFDPTRLPPGQTFSLGYMPLLQLNRAIRYILYVISQQ